MNYLTEIGCQNTKIHCPRSITLWEKRTLVLVTGFVVVEVSRMVIDETLASIVLLLISAIIGWLFSRIENAHKKTNKEIENRYKSHLELMKCINNKMNKNDVIELVDSRVNPISRDVSEIKIDIKEVSNKIDGLR